MDAGMNVKPLNVAVPPGPVTDTSPDEPLATNAVMLMSDTTVKEAAAVPPKLTAVVPARLVPVMVTVCPLTALVGVNDEMLLSGINVNPPREAVPIGVVTVTTPEVPLATTAVIVVADTTVNEVAAVPPKVTIVAPVRLVPVMVTVPPLTVVAGVKEVIVGAGKKV